LFRPKLKDKYHVEYVDGEGIFLLGERDSHVLEGVHLTQIVPLIDGRRTVNEILAAASPMVMRDDALRALDVLATAGHLVEADPALPPAHAAFWSELNVDTRYAVTQLAQAGVRVTTIGPVDPGPIVSALQAFTVRLDPFGGVEVVVTDDYLHPKLAAINHASLHQGRPLLLVKPVGIRLWIGPLIIPVRTACWRCLAIRLNANREVENYVERKSAAPGPFPITRSRVGLAEHQAAAMIATQLVRWLVTGANPELESRVLVADILAFSFDFHQVVRLPQCPECGNPACASSAGQPIEVREGDVVVDRQGGLRIESPEATFARLRHHVSPFTGVVSSITPAMWHGVGPIRTYMAGHNFALKSDQLWFLKDGLRTNSSGKGRTDAQARTSALCEALERHSGVYRGDEPRIRASFDQLGAEAIDPRSSMLYSERQYQEREIWLARNSRFQVVPLPFRTDAEIEWTPLWSMTEGRPKYLPTSYLYYNYPTPPEQFYCWADSNGCAAGSTLEDAILQGLLELVERDAVCLWWYNRVRRPGVDLRAFDTPFAEEMLRFYRAHEREVWALDLTSDLGIPVVAAISRRVDCPTEDIMLGFGAHFDASIALNRALTELNQFIPALLNRAPDGSTIYVMGDNETLQWWRTASIESQPYLLPSDTHEPMRPPKLLAGDGGGIWATSQSVGASVKRLVALLEAHGHEVLALDQTRPDIGLPVVKMVVPGLRHFWARFASGRLYDVPVAMGWRDTPLDEADVNEIAMFL
jgi:oxazoline/thiazoline synthase